MSIGIQNFTELLRFARQVRGQEAKEAFQAGGFTGLLEFAKEEGPRAYRATQATEDPMRESRPAPLNRRPTWLEVMGPVGEQTQELKETWIEAMGPVGEQTQELNEASPLRRGYRQNLRARAENERQRQRDRRRFDPEPTRSEPPARVPPRTARVKVTPPASPMVRPASRPAVATRPAVGATPSDIPVSEVGITAIPSDQLTPADLEEAFIDAQTAGEIPPDITFEDMRLLPEGERPFGRETMGPVIGGAVELGEYLGEAVADLITRTVPPRAENRGVKVGRKDRLLNRLPRVPTGYATRIAREIKRGRMTCFR